MSTSVVVVSHHPASGLEACLESVLGHADEVLVVDNASEGESVSVLARRLGARPVRLTRNAGFAGGANAGIAQATGDVVALLNDDAVAGADWLSRSSALLSDPLVAAVGPKVLLARPYLEVLLDDDPWWAPGDERALGRCLTSATLGGEDLLAELVGAGIHRLETDAAAGSRWRWTSGRSAFYVPAPAGGAGLELLLNGEPIRPARVVTLVNSAGTYLREDGYAGDIGDSEPEREELDAPAERFGVSGVAFVTSRASLARVGRFVPRYFAYYEDTDWCWRARLMGLRVIYEPSATVRHIRGATSAASGAGRVQYLAERNRLITLLRNAPIGLAAAETRRKHRGGGDDGVAEVLWRAAPRALAERAWLRRAWTLTPREVFDRWATPGSAH